MFGGSPIPKVQTYSAFQLKFILKVRSLDKYLHILLYITVHKLHTQKMRA